MSLNDLRPVNCGHWPEVSVKGLYKEFAERPEIPPYLPPKLNKGRTLDKTYFFNIVSTFFNEEFKSILDFANKQRNSETEVKEKQESILMSEEMAELMFKHPFLCK